MKYLVGRFELMSPSTKHLYIRNIIIQSLAPRTHSSLSFLFVKVQNRLRKGGVNSIKPYTKNPVVFHNWNNIFRSITSCVYFSLTLRIFTLL